MINRLIRFFGSIHLGIFLIAAIAVSSVWGSLIAADAKQGVDHAIAKVFGAPWFLVLVAALAINLILCSWEKTVLALSLPWRRHFANSAEFFPGLHSAAKISPPPDDAVVQAVFKKHFRFFETQGPCFYAQKGLGGRFGATVIHIGLLLVMGATVVRGLAGMFGWGIYDGNLIVNEGQTMTHYYTRRNRLLPATANNLRPHPLPFSFRVLDFTAEKYPNSEVVRSFRALVEAKQHGDEAITEISMATPFFWHGYKVTLNSYSEAPSEQRMHFFVEDKGRSGAPVELDAKEGDPVRLPLPGQDSDLFFEYRVKDAQKTYRIVDLKNGRILEEGRVESRETLQRTANELMQTLQQLPEAIVILGFFAENDHVSAVEPKTTAPLQHRAGVLLAYFSAGKLADQRLVPVGTDALTPIGERWLVHFSLADNTDHASAGIAQVLGQLDVFSAHNTQQTSTSVSIKAGDIFALAEENGVQVTLVEPLAADRTEAGAPQLDVSTSAPVFRSASRVQSGAPTKRFSVREAGSVPAYTVFFGIMRDPALPWFYFGCAVILVGVALAFGITYREIWGWRDDTTHTLYIGLRFYRRESARALDEFWQIVESLQRGCHATNKASLSALACDDTPRQEAQP
ncbi:MAG: cytochrome c biogenesis protein ResB [Candidatus Sumerlaeaceae bacterium]